MHPFFDGIVFHGLFNSVSPACSILAVQPKDNPNADMRTTLDSVSIDWLGHFELTELCSFGVAL